MSRNSFKDLLPESRILDSVNDCEAYGHDWCRAYEGKASAVLLPENTREVQAIVQRAGEQKIALIPSGGRTGLSASATATSGEVVVSLERMRKIYGIDIAEQTIHCQAGVITEQIQRAAKEHGLYYPIDLASAGSSQIGGNIATNAGGIHVIRYGSTRQWVLGLEVVTGRGEILNLNGKLVKNQTGYDFRSLFVGSEGTLGFITECTLRLTRLPRSFPRIFCAAREMSDALRILELARSVSNSISAFEFFTEACLQYVLQHHSFRRPFSTVYPYYFVIEVEDMTDEESLRFQELFATALEQAWVSDVIFSQSQQQADDFMELRERIGETTASHYVVQKNDISVPVSSIPAFLRDVDELAKSTFVGCDILLFGHVGDGNIHLNIVKGEGLSRDEFFALCRAKESTIFELIAKYHGAVSAEHGIGLLKKDYLHYSRTMPDVELMRGVKRVFDPDGILNPGKIFDL
jgi:FAD/FMN-containing dehydrogenase